jgi:hypothetical protein
MCCAVPFPGFGSLIFCLTLNSVIRYATGVSLLAESPVKTTAWQLITGVCFLLRLKTLRGDNPELLRTKAKTGGSQMKEYKCNNPFHKAHDYTWWTIAIILAIAAALKFLFPGIHWPF